MEDQNGPETPATELRCAECDTAISPGQDHETTGDGIFCRPCFDKLTSQLEQVLAEQGRDINYAGALAGALAGAATGVLAWWGFTVLTNIAFGLVAVVIGVAVGKGVVMLSGGKRHVNLQVMATLVSTIAFFYASYLVNRTFVHRAMAEEGRALVLPLLPDPLLLFEIVKIGFGVMDLVFLAIVIYEAWKIPAPVKLAAREAA
jgi:hypothetical protein